MKALVIQRRLVSEDAPTFFNQVKGTVCGGLVLTMANAKERRHQSPSRGRHDA